MKHRRVKNRVAKELRTPKYRLRIVKSKKTYDRKRINEIIGEL